MQCRIVWFILSKSLVCQLQAKNKAFFWGLGTPNLFIGIPASSTNYGIPCFAWCYQVFLVLPFVRGSSPSRFWLSQSCTSVRMIGAARPELNVRLSGFGFTVQLRVSCEKLDRLLALPKEAARQKVINANSKVIESIVCSEFCAVFNVRDITLAFQSYWQRMLSNRIVISLWWLNSARCRCWQWCWSTTRSFAPEEESQRDWSRFWLYFR